VTTVVRSTVNSLLKVLYYILSYFVTAWFSSFCNATSGGYGELFWPFLKKINKKLTKKRKEKVVKKVIKNLKFFITSKEKGAKKVCLKYALFWTKNNLVVSTNIN